MGAHVMGVNFKPDGDGGASMSTSEGQTSVTFLRSASLEVTD